MTYYCVSFNFVLTDNQTHIALNKFEGSEIPKSPEAIDEGPKSSIIVVRENFPNYKEARTRFDYVRSFTPGIIYEDHTTGEKNY